VPEQIPILIEASLDRGHEAADSTFDERRALLADDALSGGEFFAGSGGGEPLDHAGASEAVAEIGRPPVDLALFDGAHAAWPASRSQGPAGAHGFQLLEVREPFPGGRGRQEKGGAPAIPSPVAGRDVVPAEPMSMSGTGPLAGGAAAESIVRSASPSASLPAERADGDASRAAARDAGTLVNGPAGAASRDLPRGGRAFLSAFWHGSSHAIGEGSSTILERRVEMRLSTVLVAAMAMIVVTTLVLTYLRMDSPPDPLLPDGRLTSLPAPSSGELSARLSKGEAGAEALPPTRPDDSVGASSAADSLAAGGAGAQGRSETALRKMPIWGPASSARPMTPEELAASPPARPIPDVRNVESIAAATSAGDPSKEGAARTEAGVLEGRAAAEEDAAASDSPNFYIIQVRAKESWEGAQRIVEHLGVFGFDKPLVEQDRGGHSAYADKLYTVFVGRYYDKEQADRECRRLKRETRQRPYKDREGFLSGQPRHHADALTQRESERRSVLLCGQSPGLARCYLKGP
jgi:hypothetical protein